MKRILLFLVMMILPSTAAYADIVNKTVRITCAPELSFFDLYLSNINGETASNSFDNNADEVYKKYGFIYLGNILDDDFTTECTINDKKYVINMNAYKGTWCSGTLFLHLKITEDDVVLFDLPLGNCLGPDCPYDSCEYDMANVTFYVGEEHITIGGFGLGNRGISVLKWMDELRSSPITELSDLDTNAGHGPRAMEN